MRPLTRSSYICRRGLPRRLGDPVDQLAVADLVLDLGGQRALALQRRGAGDPLALGQRAHDLAVGVHLDELEVQPAVLVGHPVVRLDQLARVDPLEELLGPALVVACVPVACRSPVPGRRSLEDLAGDVGRVHLAGPGPSAGARSRLERWDGATPVGVGLGADLLPPRPRRRLERAVAVEEHLAGAFAEPVVGQQRVGQARVEEQVLAPLVDELDAGAEGGLAVLRVDLGRARRRGRRRGRRAARPGRRRGPPGRASSPSCVAVNTSTSPATRCLSSTTCSRAPRSHGHTHVPVPMRAVPEPGQLAAQGVARRRARAPGRCRSACASGRPRPARGAGRCGRPPPRGGGGPGR